MRCRSGVYGSTAWEFASADCATGTRARTSTSCATSRRAPGCPRASRRSPTARATSASRLDGEIRFTGGRAVAWRELAEACAGTSSLVLAKGERDVALAVAASGACAAAMNRLAAASAAATARHAHRVAPRLGRLAVRALYRRSGARHEARAREPERTAARMRDMTLATFYRVDYRASRVLSRRWPRSARRMRRGARCSRTGRRRRR